MTQRVFPSGSVRDCRKGKGRYDLLPWGALRRVAEHVEIGAEKYGEKNWEKGQPLSTFMDSAARHLGSFMEGYGDEDHLAAAAWNILAAMQTEKWVGDGRLPIDLIDAGEFAELGLHRGKM